MLLLVSSPVEKNVKLNAKRLLQRQHQGLVTLNQYKAQKLKFELIYTNDRENVGKVCQDPLEERILYPYQLDIK